ncbi:MAG: ArgE/DapE family deacylase [Verrucomicrobia bacterium]|nr:ArgE/DapE family deacylase [Verrucomicrobiota bacterium]
MNPADQLMQIVRQKKDRLIELTQALVKIPSVNEPPNGNEKPCQEFLRKRLQAMGAQTDLFTLDEIPGLRDDPFYNPGRDAVGRPDLVGVWKGTGGGRSLMLTGHADVVGIGNPSLWNNDPWSGALKDGFIHGRGASDMKGGLAAELIAIEAFLEWGELRGDLIFACVVDEEFGGMNGTLAVVRRGYHAEAAILAEPTGLEILPATGGGLQYRIHAQGKSAFETRKEEGECAILRMTRVVQGLDELEKARCARFRNAKYFGRYPIPAPICVIGIQGGDIQVGGVADKCWIEVWHQALPGETEAQVIGEVKSLFKKLAQNDPWLANHMPDIEPRCKWIDPCAVPERHDFTAVISGAWRQVMSREPELGGFMGATDASRLQLTANTATVNFGPTQRQIHQPNENVSVEELVITAQVMALTILGWCGLTNESMKGKER